MVMRLFWLSGAALVVGACGLGFNPDLPSGSASEDPSSEPDIGDDRGEEISDPTTEPSDNPGGGAGGMGTCDVSHSEMGGAGNETCR